MVSLRTWPTPGDIQPGLQQSKVRHPICLGPRLFVILHHPCLGRPHDRPLLGMDYDDYDWVYHVNCGSTHPAVGIDPMTMPRCYWQQMLLATDDNQSFW